MFPCAERHMDTLYSVMASVYDMLFPLNPECIAALEALTAKTAARPPALLDLGAASGSLVQALRGRGWEAWGIEIEPAMAERAGAHVITGRMQDALSIAEHQILPALAEKIDGRPPAVFDAIVCLGNTLPHLDPSARPRFFDDIKSMLRPNAPFIIQTLNYERPDIGPGFVFPDMSAGNVRFSRRYEQGPVPESLSFVTRLRIECEIHEDRTVLYPLSPRGLQALLSERGFERIDWYSGWNLKPFDAGKDMYCICVARAP